jgi:hypothetical protein
MSHSTSKRISARTLSLLFAAAAAAAASTFLVAGPSALGSIQLVDQTRVLSANADSTLLPETVTTSGVFNDTLNRSDIGTRTDMNFDTTTYNVTSSAQQNSNASASDLSGTSSVMASAQQTPGFPSIIAEAVSVSTYKVDFTVDAATAFTITGDITGSGTYHLGPLENTKSSVTFSTSSSMTPLYTLSDSVQVGFTGPFSDSYDDPISFSTTLQPGQTYTLDVEASSDSKREGSGATSLAPGNAGFSFTAAVPEPGALSLVLLTSPLLLSIRRRVNPR